MFIVVQSIVLYCMVQCLYSVNQSKTFRFRECQQFWNPELSVYKVIGEWTVIHTHSLFTKRFKSCSKINLICTMQTYLCPRVTLKFTIFYFFYYIHVFILEKATFQTSNYLFNASIHWTIEPPVRASSKGRRVQREWLIRFHLFFIRSYF